MLDLDSFEEKKEFALVKQLVKPGMTVFDVGAHIGYYTTLFSQLVGDQGKVYAFEPTPEIFSILKENTPFKNIYHINLALYDNVGECEFYLFEDKFNSFNSLKIPSTKHKPVKIINVRTDYLEGFCSDYNIEKIDYLKIDAEGAEYFILKGAFHYLRKKLIKFIQFEISQAFLRGFGIESRQIFGYLNLTGYECHKINPDGSIGGEIHNTAEYQENFIAFPRKVA